VGFFSCRFLALGVFGFIVVAGGTGSRLLGWGEKKPIRLGVFIFFFGGAVFWGR